MRALLRRRAFRTLWLGQTLSAFGDYAMFLAMGIWAKTLTGSNAAAGLTVLPFAVPALFGPALGVVADRFPRRHVMIATDLFAGCAMLTLFFVHDRSDLWILYTVAFAYGTAVTIYQGARSGLLVGMLPEDELGDANGMLQASNQAMRLAAPLAGAGLFAALGGHAVAALDAATFFVSAALLAAVRTRDIAKRADPLRLWTEIREGTSHIWHTLDLRRLTIGIGLLLLLIGMSEVGIYAVIDEGLHKPPAFLGIISAVQGAASLGAGLMAGGLMRKVGDIRAIALGAVAGAVAIGLFGLAVLPLVFVGAVAGGLANSFLLIGYSTVMQTRTPLALQGRVMAALEAVVTVPFLFSIAVGALLISRISFRVIYAVEAVGITLLAIYFFVVARQSDRDRGRAHVDLPVAAAPEPAPDVA
jgi:MFS family permease